VFRPKADILVVLECEWKVGWCAVNSSCVLCVWVGVCDTVLGLPRCMTDYRKDLAVLWVSSTVIEIAAIEFGVLEAI